MTQENVPIIENNLNESLNESLNGLLGGSSVGYIKPQKMSQRQRKAQIVEAKNAKSNNIQNTSSALNVSTMWGKKFNTFETSKSIENSLRKQTDFDAMKNISYKLSKILRHNAIKCGLKMDKGGRVSVEDLLKLKEMDGITKDMLKDVVETNDKQRYKYYVKNNVYSTDMIRANQGHSEEIGSKLDPTEMFEEILIPCRCIHGTTNDAYKKILTTGLNKMTRAYIHFAEYELGDARLKSGMRWSSDVSIHIDMKMAMDDGIKFFRSENDVILTTGINGVLDTKYFEKCVEVNKRTK